MHRIDMNIISSIKRGTIKRKTIFFSCGNRNCKHTKAHTNRFVQLDKNWKKFLTKNIKFSSFSYLLNPFWWNVSCIGKVISAGKMITISYFQRIFSLLQLAMLFSVWIYVETRSISTPKKSLQKNSNRNELIFIFWGNCWLRVPNNWYIMRSCDYFH